MMHGKRFPVCAAAILLLLTGSCGKADVPPDAGGAGGQTAELAETEAAIRDDPQEVAELTLKMQIGETPVAVEWEDCESVEALKELCPLTIQMSMYGGFEQVGPIGRSLPRDDRQTDTEAGDIVLYSGNQLVVFYGSNSWSYTRLGRITDKSAEELADLLGNGDVAVTLSAE
ncbi:MAG: hypothetical protein II779_03910 [Clostridia bacterium]|nr:hypothetical protein [Clostridia bacterium]